MRWKTAREVGGDFYDFFDIPTRNGYRPRLGLLIADVADKGMPAALFMTLVRTLMRAAVRDLDSPAEVLQRVNGILLPDAERGMFVTLVYLVLDLENGCLTYANAGHNPPVLWRPEPGQVEHLYKTGMALGVMEDTPLTERTLQMQPGDYLVLYTDGLSEAFSAQGDMFGDGRVVDIIQNSTLARFPSAEKVLDDLERAMIEFLGDMPQADDLTLLCLRRILPAVDS
jgi:sigma-B regulation protein RsbU (phosphoserine phosphatase)